MLCLVSTHLDIILVVKMWEGEVQRMAMEGADQEFQ